MASTFDNRQREIIANMKEDFRTKRIGLIPSISFIRIDKVIQNNQSAIEFNLTEKATTFRDGVERTLDKTDFFQALGLGVFLCVENKSKPGSGQLLTYPNPDQIALLNGSVVSGGNPLAEDLGVFYNGLFEMKIGTETVVNGLTTQRFRVVPNTQQNALNSFDEQRFGDGMIQLEPNIKIWGNESNVGRLTIPSFPNNKVQSNNTTHEIRVVLLVHGVLVPGGVAVKSDILRKA